MGNTKRLQRLLTLTFLSVIAWLLQHFIAFPVLPGMNFLTVDPSDIAVLIGGLFAGVPGMIIICAVRWILAILLGGGLNPFSLIGQSIAFAASLAFCIPFYLICKNLIAKGETYKKKILKYLIACVVSIVSLVIVMALGNYFVFMPAYIAVGFDLNALHITLKQYVMSGVLPFNVIKGIILSIIFIIFTQSSLIAWIRKNKV
ncbi:MAG: ECF transporter S component [Lactobacillales bacterium]|jgi:riboflavin transporter FmnP|nr:ECF transporter S component [Lactobacillales bacterium]